MSASRPNDPGIRRAGPMGTLVRCRTTVLGIPRRTRQSGTDNGHLTDGVGSLTEGRGHRRAPAGRRCEVMAARLSAHHTNKSLHITNNSSSTPSLANAVSRNWQMACRHVLAEWYLRSPTLYISQLDAAPFWLCISHGADHVHHASLPRSGGWV